MKVCKICDKRCITRAALLKHIEDAHGIECQDEAFEVHTDEELVKKPKFNDKMKLKKSKLEDQDWAAPKVF